MKRNNPDANQPEIVQALRDIGARVFLIGQPLDLLVGFRGKLILMEIKNPDGEDKVSRSQQVTIDLLESVGVHVPVVRSVDEAIEAVS
jgi:hypothetical protein